MPDATKLLHPRRRMWLLGALAFVLALFGLGLGSILATVEGLPANQPSNAAAASTSPKSESPSPSASPSPSIPAGAAAIPDVIGKRLPEADKELKAAGFTDIRLEDASGNHRIVLEKNNWLVTATDPIGYADSPDKPLRLFVRKPTDGKGSQTFEAGVMPDVVCKDLQDAQDGLRKAGFRVITVEDASGRKRPTIVARDWIVISQSERVGSNPTAYQRITLRVVRYAEPTGDSGCES